jgi:hypothetical protein
MVLRKETIEISSAVTDVPSDPVRELTDAAEEVHRLKERIDRAHEAERASVLRDPAVARPERGRSHDT